MPVLFFFWLLLSSVAGLYLARYTSWPVDQLPINRASKRYSMTLADLFALVTLSCMVMSVVMAAWPMELEVWSIRLVAASIALPLLVVAAAHVSVLNRRGVTHEAKRLAFLAVWLPLTVVASAGMAVGLFLFPMAVMDWHSSANDTAQDYFWLVSSIVGISLMLVCPLRLLNAWVAAGCVLPPEKEDFEMGDSGQ